MMAATVDGRLTSYATATGWATRRLNASTLNAYVDKTFGRSQRCLKVAADDTAEAAAIVAALNRHRLPPPGWRDEDATAVHARTIELDDSASDGGSASCLAYVVVGRQLPTVEKFMENFKSNAAERMLVVIVQKKKNIKPFIKVSIVYIPKLI